MTNKELLKADLLDILFENRNKDYGAYALRREYDKRLLTALAAALALIIVFAIIGLSGNKNNLPLTTESRKDIIEIREIVLPKEPPKEPDQPKEQHKPVTRQPVKTVEKIAREKFTSKIEIKPDEQVKDPLPDVASLENKIVSDTKETGKPDNGVPKEIQKTMETGSGNTGEKTEPLVVFKPEEKNAEFPGGPDALKKFLANNLRTPSDLEDGEIKTILIRFKVDKDGTVNTFQIVTSGGPEFDNEVVRVCKKMPRWTPAVQNGINVPVNYMLPVTFIGVVQ